MSDFGLFALGLFAGAFVLAVVLRCLYIRYLEKYLHGQ